MNVPREELYEKNSNSTSMLHDEQKLWLTTELTCERNNKTIRKSSSSSNNLAKINWWYTPFKPLTIETIVDHMKNEENEKIELDCSLEQEQTNADKLLQDNLNLNKSSKAMSSSTTSDGLHRQCRQYYEQLKSTIAMDRDIEEAKDDQTYTFNGKLL